MIKANKLDTALGYVEGKYLDEAEGFAKRRPKLRSILIAAAVITVLAVGVAAVGIRYFAPGVGITDGGVRVTVADEKPTVGDIVIESVMMSDSGDVSVWVSREKEILPTPEEIESGVTPAELSELSLIIGGTGYIPSGMSLSTSGYSYYSFEKIPAADELTIRTFYGDAKVRMRELTESDGYYTSRFGKNEISFVRLGNGLWQAELRDDFALGLAKKASQSDIFLSLAAKDENGGLSFPDGRAILYGAENPSMSGITSEAGDFTELSLLYVDLSFQFDYQSGTPALRITLPENGKSAEGGRLFENDCLTVNLDSVSLGENGLELSTSESRGKDFPEFVRGFSVEAAAYVEDNGEVCLVMNDGGKAGYYRYTDDDAEFIELKPGDEITVKLGSVWCMYSEKGTSKDSFSPNLAEIKLK